jgi:hypothetical protein
MQKKWEQATIPYKYYFPSADEKIYRTWHLMELTLMQLFIKARIFAK